MTVRRQRGQLTSRSAEPRVSRPGKTRERRVTVPPIQRHNLVPAILSLKNELDRLINEIGRYIDNDGRVAVIDFLISGMRSGQDRTLVTGTAGTSGELLEWNADGDAVDSGVTADSVVEGPASAADNSVPTYDATTGKLLQDQGAVFIDDSGNVGVGTASPASPLHVDQSSATGAVPVLTLDQGDDSEEMIEFIGTIGTGNALEAVGAKTLTTTHFIKVTLPGGLSRYIPAGTIA